MVRKKDLRVEDKLATSVKDKRLEEVGEKLAVIIEGYAKQMREAAKDLGIEDYFKVMQKSISSGEWWRLNDAEQYNLVLKKWLPMEMMFSIVGIDDHVEDFMRALILDKLDGTWTRMDDDAELGYKELEEAEKDMYGLAEVVMGETSDYLAKGVEVLKENDGHHIAEFKGKGTAQSSFDKHIRGRMAERMKDVKLKEKDVKGIDIEELGGDAEQ